MNNPAEYQRAMRTLYLKKIIPGSKCKIVLSSPISSRDAEGVYHKIFSIGDVVDATLKQMKLGECFFEVTLPDGSQHFVKVTDAKPR
jgi:hypothetical protein